MLNSWQPVPGYEESFAIWKDADADVPILIEAKAEYARLRK